MQPPGLRASTGVSASHVGRSPRNPSDRAFDAQPVFRRKPDVDVEKVNDKGVLTREAILYANLYRIGETKLLFVPFWQADRLGFITNVLSEMLGGVPPNMIIATRLPGGGVHMHPPFEVRLYHPGDVPSEWPVEFEQIAPNLYLIPVGPPGYGVDLVLNGKPLGGKLVGGRTPFGNETARDALSRHGRARHSVICRPHFRQFLRSAAGWRANTARASSRCGADRGVFEGALPFFLESFPCSLPTFVLRPSRPSAPSIP